MTTIKPTNPTEEQADLACIADELRALGPILPIMEMLEAFREVRDQLPDGELLGLYFEAVELLVPVLDRLGELTKQAAAKVYQRQQEENAE